MKKIISLLICCITSVVLLQYRVANSDIVAGQPPLKVTVWDAFGYYVYLPSICIYHDYTQLKWLPNIDKKYAVTGGDGYQALKLDNGNYTFKYLCGYPRNPVFSYWSFHCQTQSLPARWVLASIPVCFGLWRYLLLHTRDISFAKNITSIL